MKRKNLVVATFLVLLFCGIMLVACTPNEIKLQDIKNKRYFDESNWQITFQDNFDDQDTFEKNWKFNIHDTGKRHGGYYTQDNVFLQGGNLVIRTNWKESSLGTGWHTGWLESAVTRYTDNWDLKDGRQDPEGFEGFNQKFGYFEIRCKAPATQGIWSAFWLLPENREALSENDKLGTGEDGVEIDIYESAFYQDKKKSKIQHVIHADYNATNKPVTAHSKGILVDDMYNQFHTYAVEWNEDEYIFYVDGIETWRTNHYNGTAKVEQFMIMSVEVGSDKVTWAGDPMKNDKSKNYDLVVDYVKVMEKIN